MKTREFVEGQGWKVIDRFTGRVTPEGGRGRKLTNKTGAASVRGTIVVLSDASDMAVEVAPAGSESPFGVIYDNDIPDGEECFVVTDGFTPVLLKNGTASVAGNWVIVSNDTAGRADATAAEPVPLDHWQEIGHAAESKDAGADVLVLCSLHFN